MKSTACLLACALLLVCATAAMAQLAAPLPPSTVSYLSQGRYLIFQGNYVNDKGVAESGLVKFDSQTGMAWMLRPAPKAENEGEGLGFNWVPVKN